MKKTAAVLAAAMIFQGMALTAHAEDTQLTAKQSGNLLYQVMEDNTVTVTGWEIPEENLIIPAEIEGLPVTAIGSEAFSAQRVWITQQDITEDMFSLQSIQLPDTLVSIGAKAFYWNVKLQEVTIPDSVNSIGAYAFSGCGLKKLEIPDSVHIIMDGAFSRNPFTEVIIPDGISTIPASAFQACLSLEKVTLPENLSSIGTSAFQSCKSLTEIAIPDSVRTISEAAFRGCESLKEVHFPAHLTYLGKQAFSEADLTGKISLPDGLAVMGAGAFGHCANLTEVIIPDSVVTFEEDGCQFQLCKNLQSVTLPSGIQKIPDGMFGATGLTELTLPNTVTSVGEMAFWACFGLKKLTFLNPDCQIFDSEDTINENTVIYGCQNSTAHDYALAYGREFVALDETPSQTGTVTPGDINQDSSIDIMDVILMNKAIFGKITLTAAQDKAADINGNGAVDSTDALIMMKYIIHIIDSLT